MNNEIMDIKEAAEALGVTELHLRTALRQGLYPFGVAVKSKTGRRCRYVIYRTRLSAYIAAKL